MADRTQDKIDNVMYSYATDVSHLEEENRLLKETLEHLKEEIGRMKSNPLMVCEVKEIMDKNAVIRIPNGNSFFVDISLDIKDLSVGDTVLCEQKNLTVLKKIPATKRFDVEKFVIMDTPKVKWKDIGGLKTQIEEIKEVIELPLKHPELFKKIGIEPPRGVLLYGPPGTGKTLLAKAVAASTKSQFIEIVGSELVQKFIGEGAKLVKEIFQLARENSPSIIFIDEIDALAATRIDVGTSGEREVQRTFMQLLAEIDGFKPLGNVKIIGCTNRKDILDPAVIRPGRLDRLIKVPIPDDAGITEIFKIYNKQMPFEKLNLPRIIKAMEGFAGAEIKAVCTEAGYFAIREKRDKITQRDVLKAIEKVRLEEDDDDTPKHMFG
jgi:proteasome regulatory subunit